MASLIISRNDRLLNKLFPLHIYTDKGKVGKVSAGETEEFLLDEDVSSIQAKKGLAKSPEIPLNTTSEDKCIFYISTHPAIGLIRSSLIISTVFFIALLIVTNGQINWMSVALFGFPMIVLFVAGAIFCRSHYFVIKEVDAESI